jgi:hypothetical protein
MSTTAELWRRGTTSGGDVDDDDIVKGREILD